MSVATCDHPTPNTPASAQAPVEVAPPPLDIDELLICSDEGDVFHAWQCENTELRINLLQFVAQKARLLQNTLPFGGFDRAEFIASGSRLISRITPDGRVVLRASLAGTAAAKNEPILGSTRAPASAQVRNKASQWFEERLNEGGLYAAILQFPDRTGPSNAVPEFTAEAVELLTRSTTDGFQVLKLQRFHGQRARWLFEHVGIECAQWRDGTSLALVFERAVLDANQRTVGQQIQLFLGLEQP